MRKILMSLIFALPFVCIPGTALADDWVAVKLRGTALVFVDGQWVELERGAVVPDDRVVRTMGGRLTLTRGAETIELGPNTQIQIFDKAGRKPFTTVKEHFGTVAVEAEVKDVEHFAVETPYLVAVVKGTRFEVVTDSQSSEVSVDRGSVAVEAHETRANVLLAVGQSAEVGLERAMTVTGKGALPAVLDASGKPANASQGAGNAGNASNAGGSGSSAKSSNAGGNSAAAPGHNK